MMVLGVLNIIGSIGYVMDYLTIYKRGLYETYAIIVILTLIIDILVVSRFTYGFYKYHTAPQPKSD